MITKSYLANIHWGIQRSLGRRLIFNSHVGVGYAWDIPSGFGTIYPSLDFRFSYVLQSHKSVMQVRSVQEFYLR